MRNIFSTVIFLPCLFTLISCKGGHFSNETTKESIEHSYDEISDREIVWNDIFSISCPDYFVYFYSPTCSHCNRIKNVIIEYALTNESMYFIRFSDDVVVSGDVKNTIGVNSIDNLSILGTPSLLEVKNKVVETNIAGERAILEFLNLGLID